MTTRAEPARRLLDHAVAATAQHLSDRELLERFAAGDASAFAAIFDRHGPMLLGCCRRWIDDAHLAEDVLQATFLVLARNSTTIRRRDSLPSWLFAVARRLARRARLSEEARSKRERNAAARRADARRPELDELLRALDEELARLPEEERSPLLLCYLEGRTQDEAAAQLGLTLITLRRRLERGRERLRSRLTRRGLTLGAALLAGAIAPEPAAVGDELRRVVLAVAVGGSKLCALSPSVVALADGGVRMTTAAARTAVWSAIAVLACGALVGAAWLHRPAEAPKGTPAEPPAERKPPPAEVKRDRFNDPLPAGAIARLGTLAFRHGGEVNRLYFAADGKSIWTGGGGVRRRWQLDTGQEIDTLDFRDPARELRADSLSDDGRTAVAIYGDHMKRDPFVVVVRDAFTRQVRREFTVPNSYYYVISADARYLSVDRVRETQIWDMTTGQLSFTTPLGYPRFSADGKTMVICDPWQKISVWDLDTGERRREFGGGETHQFKGMALSRDGKWLVTQGRTFGEPFPAGPSAVGRQEIPDDFLRVWDIEKGELAHTLKTGWMLRNNFSFSPDGNSLLVPVGSHQDWRYSVQQWEVKTGRLKSTWPTGLHSCRAAALSPDRKTLATATDSGCIQLWDTTNRRELRDNTGHNNAVHFASFSQDGKFLRTGSCDRVHIDWDLTSSVPKRCREEPALLEGGAITYSADGRFRLQVVGSPESRIVVCDLIGDRPPREFGKVADFGRGFGIARDGSRIAVVGAIEDRVSVRSWDVESGKLISDSVVRNAEKTHFFVRLLGDGRLILTGNGLLIGFDKGGRETCRWQIDLPPPKPGEAREIAMGPSDDGRYVACFMSASPDWKRGALEVRELENGRIVRRLADEVGRNPFAFSPDAKLIAGTSAGFDSSILVWEVESGKKRHEFKGHRGKITSLAFSPDGKRLASGSEDCTALIWNVEP